MAKSFAEIVCSFKELFTAHEAFCRASLSEYDSAGAKYAVLRCNFAESLKELCDENERLKNGIKSNVA